MTFFDRRWWVNVFNELLEARLAKWPYRHLTQDVGRKGLDPDLRVVLLVDKPAKRGGGQIFTVTWSTRKMARHRPSTLVDSIIARLNLQNESETS